MPSGTVRFFDEEKGFGFINGENGEQVYVHATALPKNAEMWPGTRVEYSVADGRRGPHALQVRLLDRPKAQRRNRKTPDDMAVIVEDLVSLLDSVGSRLKANQFPDRAQARKVATMLRHVADEFDV